MTEGEDYRIYLVHFPFGVRGCTRISPDGFINIYISDRLSTPEQKKTATHELRHAIRDDFYNGLPIEEIKS